MNASQRRVYRRHLERNGLVRMTRGKNESPESPGPLYCLDCSNLHSDNEVVAQDQICACGRRWAKAVDGDVMRGRWQPVTGLDQLREAVENDDNDHAS